MSLSDDIKKWTERYYELNKPAPKLGNPDIGLSFVSYMDHQIARTEHVHKLEEIRDRYKKEIVCKINNEKNRQTLATLNKLISNLRDTWSPILDY
jgi:hypothetical protein